AEPAAKPRPPHEAAPAGPAALATLAALWLAGTLAWCGLALSRVRRFRRLLDFAEPAPSWLREEGDGLAARLGPRRGRGGGAGARGWCRAGCRRCCGLGAAPRGCCCRPSCSKG